MMILFKGSGPGGGERRLREGRGKESGVEQIIVEQRRARAEQDLE